MSMPQARDGLGQFASTSHSAPTVTLERSPEADALHATLVDFLEGSLPGFGFDVNDVDPAVTQLVGSLLVSHAG